MDKKYVDFNTIREDYNVYQIENGHILKLKKVLSNIYQKKDPNGKGIADIDTQDFSYVATPIDIDTSELETADPKDVTAKDNVKELKFTVLKDGLNIYETKNTIIIISNDVSNIFITNKKDKKGIPIYRYTAHGAVNLLEKKMLKGVGVENATNPNPNVK